MSDPKDGAVPDEDDALFETDDPELDKDLADSDPDVLNTLSKTAQEFLNDPDIETARNDDLPDDESGEEVPQDGDPGR